MPSKQAKAIRDVLPSPGELDVMLSLADANDGKFATIDSVFSGIPAKAMLRNSLGNAILRLSRRGYIQKKGEQRSVQYKLSPTGRKVLKAVLAAKAASAGS